ncbi:hypothetical protein TIFTF001_033255 [Ficus carica]|uniref:Glutaredoxin domain-containing protein n=1 Tax=Ficus carica TaxID=3494 RepID=A0AA88E064_FICCA|nr:hypothetical protein TIFTF001_033255 [Ficus carica]
MKGMKGKLLKKMKSIGTVGYLKLQDRVLQVSASDGYYPDSCPKKFDFQVENNLLSCEETEQKKRNNQSCLTEQEPEEIDVAELMKDLEENEDMELDEDADDKENIGPPMSSKGSGCLTLKQPNQEISLRRISEASELSAMETENRRLAPLSEIDVLSFRRPDLNSYSLFDPNLLAAFKQAVMEHMRRSEAERQIRIENEEYEISEEEEEEQEQERPSKAPRVEIEQEEDPLSKFDEKCPPGGEDSVILYTTSLRGIRKTFEGCSSVRFLLESFRVLYFERDVSMHSEFREELRRILDVKDVPPKLFIRGRYIGGAEEVLGLHEQGKLRPLFETVPIDRSNGPCDGCGGIRFVLCFSCNGSHKVVAEDGQCNNCSNCNENGLIICPICC